MPMIAGAMSLKIAARADAGDDFVVTLGYGESAAGYLPVERAWEEGDGNLRDWCWIAPGMESRVRAAISKLLAP